MDAKPNALASVICQLARLLEQVGGLRAELDRGSIEEVRRRALGEALRTCEAAIEMALADAIASDPSLAKHRPPHR